MLHTELEKRRPSLLLLGIIGSSALTLTAFSWKTPKTEANVLPAMTEEWAMIEADILPKSIEREERARAEAQNKSKQRSHEVIASDEDPSLIEEKGPEKMPEIKKPIQLKRNKDMSPGLALEHQTMTKGIRELAPHEMPFMRSCAQIEDPIERFQCTRNALRGEIGQNFQIPSVRKLKNLPERMIISFVIDQYGEIAEIESKEPIPEILKEEVRRVFSEIPTMVPGQTQGHRVNVRFEMPISLSRR